MQAIEKLKSFMTEVKLAVQSINVHLNRFWSVRITYKKNMQDYADMQKCKNIVHWTIVKVVH